MLGVFIGFGKTVVVEMVIFRVFREYFKVKVREKVMVVLVFVYDFYSFCIVWNFGECLLCFLGCVYSFIESFGKRKNGGLES